jgi:hypothetical protein
MSDKTARVPTVGVRFARSAIRHRVSKDSIRHVVVNYSVRFQEPPPAGREGVPDARLVFLGDDAQGRILEVMAVEFPDGDLFVIHAMPLRDKYRKKYEEAKR